MEKKRIIFCTPGSNFPDTWVESWTKTLSWCHERGIEYLHSPFSSNNVYFVRNGCLRANTHKGRHQKPFGGLIDYDYFMWIDSDAVWEPEDIEHLLEVDQPIVAGLGRIQGGHYNAFPWVDPDDFITCQRPYKSIDKKFLEEHPRPFTVDTVGFHFVLVKKGVFEAIDYPWFRPIFHEKGEYLDFDSEDFGFCHLAVQAGFEIWVDPRVIVGHEKRVVLR